MISFAISANYCFFILGVAPTYPFLHKLGLKMALFQVLLFFFKNYWIAIKVFSKYYIRQADSVNFMILPQWAHTHLQPCYTKTFSTFHSTTTVPWINNGLFQKKIKQEACGKWGAKDIKFPGVLKK